jgi:pyruvate/2-oxoglutarate dehydrogenase complex dihydrolipoamide acyltransferase (E2) component
MPVLGYDMTEGRIATWLKDVGDDIKRGEAIAEIETEKTTVEFESLAAGRLAEIVYEAGDTVAIGAVIAYLEVDG